ncbi:hypothetical protein [Flavobacterium sp. H122]|uniref:hypothetical protein n=1 Tax=Flavobacterium sp. H122 TaxID=2529860 RepID=UPI0010AB4723|nr:hypothetical protein [Flavobacterium sp. H122]
MSEFKKPKVLSFKELLNNLKNNLSIIYLLSVVFSIIIEAHYYKKFDINIFSYLDLTEYLIYFFKSFYQFIISAFITYFSCYVVFHTIDSLRFATKAYSISLTILNIVGFAFSIILSIFILNKLDIPLYFWTGIITSLIVWFLYYTPKNYSEKQLGLNEYNVPSIIFLFLVCITISSYYYHEELLENKKKVSLVLSSNKTIVIGTNLKILGETNNYIFIRDLTNKKTKIIKRDKIEEIIYE